MRIPFRDIAAKRDEATGLLLPLGNITVTVTARGTGTPVTLYTGYEGQVGAGAQSNPFVTGPDGIVFFWFDAAEIDIQLEDLSGASPPRIPDTTAYWPPAPVGAGVITGVMIADESIDQGHIVPGLGLLGPNTVGSGEIIDGSVGQNELANDNIDKSKLKHDIVDKDIHGVVPYAHFSRDNAGETVPEGNAGLDLGYNTTVDNNDSIGLSGSAITIKTAGVYQISWGGRWGQLAAPTGIRVLKIERGGSDFLVDTRAAPPANSDLRMTTSATRRLSVNDVINLNAQVFGNGGAAHDIADYFVIIAWVGKHNV